MYCVFEQERVIENSMRVGKIKLPKTNVLALGSCLIKDPDTDTKMAQEQQDADEIQNPGLEQHHEHEQHEQGLASIPDLPLLARNPGEDSDSDQYEDPVDPDQTLVKQRVDPESSNAGGRGDPDQQAGGASGGSDSSDLYSMQLIPEGDRMDEHQVDAFIFQNQSRFQ